MVIKRTRYIVTATSRWGGRYQANAKPKYFMTKASAIRWMAKAPSYLKGLRVVRQPTERRKKHAHQR